MVQSGARLFGLSSPLLSGGGPKPGWTIPKEHMWGPRIPDNQYYIDHVTYNGFTMWLRRVRPYAEKAFGDSYRTVRGTVLGVWTPARNVFVRHNPDLRLQLTALAAFYFSAASINMWHNEYYQKLMDVKSLLSLSVAQKAEEQGFWRSESEEIAHRSQKYYEDHARLEALWETALQEATITGDFATLCQYLEPLAGEAAPAVPLPATWRFNMVPYGADNEDTQTFPTNKDEQPHRAFALNFTYNNLAYNWGDYVDRQDNKNAIMRPARPMFTDVYMPGTK